MATEATDFCPRLRSDLVIEMQGEGKTRRYLIIDPASGRYFQCGTPQYMLMALFTGELTSEEIIRRYKEQTHILLRPEQLNAALQKLEELSFLIHERLQAEPQPSSPALSQRWRLQWRFNKRWRLFPVQRILLPLEAYTHWLFSSTFLAACFLFAIATWWILMHGGWSQGISSILVGLYAHPSLSVWGPFLLAILLTAMLHESAHALALQHFGRKPGYFGVGIAFPVGIFCYAEIGEVWRLTDRRQRVIVTLAGPLASLLVGAIGALAWWVMPFDVMWSPWFATLMTAGVTTAVYNAIPFVRTDGYFILADLVDIPNLDRKARSYLIQILLCPFRRQHQPAQKLAISQQMLLAGYGVITLLLTAWLVWVLGGFLWRIVVPLVLPILHLS